MGLDSYSHLAFLALRLQCTVKAKMHTMVKAGPRGEENGLGPVLGGCRHVTSEEEG